MIRLWCWLRGGHDWWAWPVWDFDTSTIHRQVSCRRCYARR